MNTQRSKLIIGSLAMIALAGCANTPERTTTPMAGRASEAEATDGRAISNAAALQMKAHNFVEVEFPAGSSNLSPSATTSLNAAIQQAQLRGPIEDVIVMSWADEEYPSKSQNKLSKEQRTLADRRNEAVKNHFRTLNGVDFEAYNMAERPNTLSRWFNTSDTKLKNSLTAAGLPTTADENQYPSKASHAVILLKVD